MQRRTRIWLSSSFIATINGEQRHEQNRANHPRDPPSAGRSISQERRRQRPSHQHHSLPILLAAGDHPRVVADDELTSFLRRHTGE